MRPTKWRLSTHVLIGVAVLILVAAVVGLAAAQSRNPREVVAIPAQPAAVTADPAVTALSDTAPEPLPARLAAVLAPFAANPDLGTLGGRVTDAETGEQLWQQGDDVPLQPASVNKVLTTAAALLSLDRDAVLTTTVLTDPEEPGLIILKGGGDPTL